MKGGEKVQLGLDFKVLSPNNSGVVFGQSSVNSNKFQLLLNTLNQTKGPELTESNDILHADEKKKASLHALLQMLTSGDSLLIDANLSVNQKESEIEHEDIIQHLLTNVNDDSESKGMDQSVTQLNQMLENVYTEVEQKLYQFLSTFHFERTSEDMFTDTDFPELVNTIKILQMAEKETSTLNKEEEISEIVEALKNLVENLINQTSKAEQEKISNSSTSEKKWTFDRNPLNSGFDNIEKNMIQKDVQPLQSSSLISDDLNLTGMNDVIKESAIVDIKNLHRESTEEKQNNLLDSLTIAELVNYMLKNGAEEIPMQQTEKIEFSSKQLVNTEEKPKNLLDSLIIAEIMKYILNNGIVEIPKQPEKTELSNKQQANAEEKSQNLLNSMTVTKLIEYIKSVMEEVQIQQLGNEELSSIQAESAEKMKQILQALINGNSHKETRNFGMANLGYPSYIQPVLQSADKQMKHVNNQVNNKDVFLEKGTDSSSPIMKIQSLVASIVEKLNTTTKIAEKPNGMYPKMINPLMVESLKKQESTISASTIHLEPNAEKIEADTKTSISIGQLQTSYPTKQQPLQILNANGNPVSSNQLEEQLNKIFSNASYIRNGDSQKFTLRLAPEHLGSIKIEVYQKEGTILAKILTATPEAKEVLDSHLTSLKHGLSLQNLVIDKVEIAYTPPGQQEKMNRDQQSHQQQQQQQKQEQSSHQEQNKQKKSFLEELLNIES